MNITKVTQSNYIWIVCDITYEVKSKRWTSSIGDKYFQTFSASQELDPVEVSGLESSGG